MRRVEGVERDAGAGLREELELVQGRTCGEEILRSFFGWLMANANGQRKGVGE